MCVLPAKKEGKMGKFKCRDRDGGHTTTGPNLHLFARYTNYDSAGHLGADAEHELVLSVISLEF